MNHQITKKNSCITHLLHHIFDFPMIQMLSFNITMFTLTILFPLFLCLRKLYFSITFSSCSLKSFFSLILSEIISSGPSISFSCTPRIITLEYYCSHPRLCNFQGSSAVFYLFYPKFVCSYG